jgi:hypothetical protein
LITYRGETFSGYNIPKPTPGGPKKSAVLAKEAGEVRLVRFGDPLMTIKKHIPARRKSFRARHHCESPGSKLSARYWSCKAW